MRPAWREEPANHEEALLAEETRERARLLDLAMRDPSARRQALLLDPSLAAVGGDEIEIGADEIARVKDAVLVTRRLQRLQSPAERRSHHGLSAVAVALLLLLVFLTPAEVDRSAENRFSPGAWPIAGEVVTTHPGVEAINLPAARVYELAEEDFEVVLIVDESLEL